MDPKPPTDLAPDFERAWAAPIRAKAKQFKGFGYSRNLRPAPQPANGTAIMKQDGEQQQGDGDKGGERRDDALQGSRRA